MGQKKNKKKAAAKPQVVPFKISSYMTRFTLIYMVSLSILMSLTYQIELNDAWVFAMIIIILTTRMTNVKFITDNKRLYSKDERMKFIIFSWGLVWVASVIVVVISTYLIAGKEVLNTFLANLSAMPTLNFITSITAASLIIFALLFVSYGFQARREFASMKKLGKI